MAEGMLSSARCRFSLLALLCLCQLPVWTVGIVGIVGQTATYEVTTFCTAPVASSPQHLLKVADGVELQAALDKAVGGDTIQLAAGATFRPAGQDASFVLRARATTSGGWVTIRSVDRAFDADGAVPPSTRVAKANANVMFLLTHFSLKYSCLELREFFNAQHDMYPNIHPMLLDDDIKEMWWRKKNRNDLNEEDESTPPTCSCRLCNNS